MNKRLKRICDFLITLFVLIIIGIAGFKVFDDYGESLLKNAVYSKIKQKNTVHKYSVNTKTDKKLINENTELISIESDNQGSGNILYYIIKIGKSDYGVMFKSAGLSKQPKLKGIKYLGK
ncbi:hypothetical protein OZX56_00585 [Lactobacillus sp. ESL0684]|uniref:hypothetical protein n=1 Tax=unclassified Lactobacillus TaxID=2620435 RepID=UPI0023F6B993|nr:MULTISPECIES: hypothetical protein [unclassified Lactobacillus]WEV39702.1 hypothetical protein OZX59_05645 [Lactobacillus sp. ESL0681]WEV43765.1 hypothetical protein OZX56_00585 [Lactobacillus sp. ESL0684]